MAGTNSKEAIVEVDEEIRGWKSVNQDKDTCLAKRVKEEGDGTEGGGGGGGEEEEEVNDKVERLHRLLKDNPRGLENKETEEVIRYLDVDDIIGWASKSGEVEETAREGYRYIDAKADKFVPSPEKVDRLMRLMLLCGIEKLKAVDLYILYNNFPKAAFVSMLLHALDSYSKRHIDAGRSLYPKEMCGDIRNACSVLSWKLFSHVMYKLTLLPVFKCTISTTSSISEEEEEDDEIQKKAAENCYICNGKGKHSGVYGYYCSYWQSVPCGVTVGPMHTVICSKCGLMSRSCRARTFVRCSCGSQEGKVVPCSSLPWDSNI